MNSEPGTLVVQTAYLGDVVLTLPLLQRLAEQHGPVDVVTTPAARQLVTDQPAIRRVILFDKHGQDRGVSGVLRLGRALGNGQYARAYLPHRSLRSALLTLLARIPERIGFAGRLPALSYTRRVAWPRAGHQSRRLLSLADPGSTAGPETVWLALTEADRAAANAWLAERGITGPIIALAPGSRWGTKRWPYYAELAALLPGALVVLGDSADIDLANSVLRAAPGRSWSAAGELSVTQSAAIIARASLLVTNDSAPLHLASALARPVVALFGPTVPAFGFGPLPPDGLVVEHAGLTCRPCSAHGPEHCPLGHHRCMREVGVGEVLAAARRLRLDD